ncbi:MAG: hypothetical protein HKN26_06760 [Acidimicrobiales bacterium]|nr:hypothetical protein [Acidimicrobiales bacterium]
MRSSSSDAGNGFSGNEDPDGADDPDGQDQGDGAVAVSGQAPVAAIEFGTVYEYVLVEGSAQYTLSVPPGSVLTGLLGSPAGNTSGVSLFANDGSVSLFAEPGNEEELDLPLVTSAEDGIETQLMVQGFPGDTIRFALDLAPQTELPDGGDAPAILTGAAELDGTAEGILGGLDTTDYYAIDVDAGDMISVELSSPPAEYGSVSASIEYNGQRREGLTAQAGGTEDVSHVVSHAEGGDWFLVVSGGGRYTATVTTQPQPDGASARDGGSGDAGDSLADALTVEPGTFFGVLGNNDDADMFTFDLVAGGQIGLTMSVVPESEGGANARILINGTEEGRISAQPGGTSDPLALLLAGDVSGSAAIEVWGSEAIYELTLTTGAQNDGGSSGDAGGDAASAKAVDPGTFPGAMGSDDPADFYTITSEVGGPATVSLAADPTAEQTYNYRVFVDGSEIARATSAAGGTSTIELELEPDTEIVIELWGGRGPYEITVAGDAFPSAGQDTTEPVID